MARAMHRLRLRRWAGALGMDERGAALLEFGLIAPTMCVLLAGALDYSHTLYMDTVLQGEVLKAGRDGTLQQAAGSSDAQRYAIDQKLTRQVKKLNRHATVTITRRFYRTFTQAAAQAAETFTDSDAPSPFHDGICNNNEPFDDRNSNGVRDTDGADSVERAGARDNVVLTVTIAYPRMFPINKFMGGSGTTSLKAVTVLANQPYGNQASYGAPAVGHCPAAPVVP